MGIDWEEILDAEGADMADAYDALVSDAFDREEDLYEEEFQDVEDFDGDDSDPSFPDDEEEQLPFAGMESFDEEIPNAGSYMETINQQQKDIRKLIILLLENDIPIPGDIIDKYIKQSSPTNSDQGTESPNVWDLSEEELPFQ